MAVTEAAVSLQDLLDYLEIQECHLKKRCNDEHVREVALLIDKWEVYASHLGLTQTEIDSIKEDGRANEEKKILALQKWKTKNAFKATFKVLIQMFLKAGNAELAEKVAIMLKKEIGETKKTEEEKPAPVKKSAAAGPPPPPPAATDGGFDDLPQWNPSNKKLSLLNITNATKTVVDWQQLGKHLHIPKHKMEAIRIDNAHYGAQKQKDEMIAFWLGYDIDASWEKLCSALESMDQRKLAKYITSVLKR